MENTEDKNIRQPGTPAALNYTHDKKRPELLAPAGDMGSALGAFAAGADAVYLGGPAFSARAYAKNLSIEEICSLLSIAHPKGKKVYLACNILIKADESEEVRAMMDPLYEAGLDGVIVQDIGLLEWLHIRYPHLPLHGSTQMAVLSEGGVNWLKERGVTRVVPGRELSLKEMEELKKCGIELECFIHGAMCYSYSGRCLLSSLAGGRSGNRGRCAGPCRKSYTAEDGREAYYLSMRDMCSLEDIGGMIDAGIDSFKIEGRMKAAEYAAGVSAVYRKYIDEYLERGSINVRKKDIELLKGLYMRSGPGNGYLFRHNGQDMISLDSPAYDKVSEEKKQEIREKYIKEPARPVTLRAVIRLGTEMSLELRCGDTSVSVSAGTPDEAKSRAVTEADCEKQFRKSGGSGFEIKECYIDTDGKCFVPVSVLNELRRKGLAELEKALAAGRRDKPAEVPEPVIAAVKKAPGGLVAGVRDPEQFGALLGCEGIDGIIVPLRDAEAAAGRHGNKAFYVRLPEIIRQKDVKKVRDKLRVLTGLEPEGVYCGSLDALYLASEFFAADMIYADQGLYVTNPYTEAILSGMTAGYTVSAELSGREIAGLKAPERCQLVIYGYTPVMYSANCIYMTKGKCDKTAGSYILKDEKGHSFTIVPEHEYCYNIMYNCVPLSLYDEARELINRGFKGGFRLEFTTEAPAECRKIAEGFSGLFDGGNAEGVPERSRTTRGHFNRGVM
ncbi:MAG: U32 family peptidase [Lachnospiraceae bacterium]|nr:U32 family peptidase [Lachnospiraceae bacterium]